MILRNSTTAICLQQSHQILYLLIQLTTLIGLTDLHAVFQCLENHGIIGDVMVVADSIFSAGEWLVGYDTQVSGVKYQSISGI